MEWMHAAGGDLPSYASGQDMQDNKARKAAVLSEKKSLKANKQKKANDDDMDGGGNGRYFMCMCAALMKKDLISQ